MNLSKVLTLQRMMTIIATSESIIVSMSPYKLLLFAILKKNCYSLLVYLPQQLHSSVER